MTRSRSAPDPDEALRLVQTDPHRAARTAARALQGARAVGDAEAAAASERALGLAAREIGDLDAAAVHLRASVATAEGAGLTTPAAEARMSLSFVLAYQGEVPGALEELALARAALRGPSAAQAELQRANLLHVAGRHGDALTGYGRALAALRRQGDTLRVARCLNNRGLLRTITWDLGPAEADFSQAERLFLGLGQDLAVADVRWNRGIVAARRGDVPTALSLFDLTEAYYARHAIPRAHLHADRCELLLSARLVAEAREAAERAIAGLSAGSERLQLAYARLSLANAALLDGDAATAVSQARLALRAFIRQGRPSWEALARFALLRSAWLRGDRWPATLAAARRTANALASAGWVVPALEARVLAARLALDLGRPEVAAEELTLASRARSSGTAEVRLQAWHAEALLRSARGDARGATAAVRAGLRVLDAHRAALGATELRVHFSVHGADLAAVGLRMAVAASDPGRVLEWAERWRAATLLLPSVRPAGSRSSAVRRELEELRLVTAELARALQDGRDPAALRGRQAGLERSIRRRSRQARGQGAAPVALAGVPVLRAALGDGALLELVEVDGVLHAVTVTATAARLHSLGPAADVTRELDALHFAMRRMARPAPLPELAAAAAASAAFSAELLDAALLRPVAADLGDGPLVVVPTGALHAVPWGMLPSCRGRPVSIAPSATLWLRARGEPAGNGEVVLVAGPGLAGAAAEVAALRRQYPGATSLTPSRATVEGVLAAMDGASLAHVAAHGRFRADNPLFSSLELGDGPLLVYDIERLRRAPRQIVLSACDSGVSAVRPGDELMGLAAALFGRKAAVLVASVVPVSDAATGPLMLAYHRQLRGGAPAAAALAAVVASRADAEPAARAAAAAFVCFGAGW